MSRSWHFSLHYFFIQTTLSLVVTSGCDRSIGSIPVSLLPQSLTVSLYAIFVTNSLICFFAAHETARIFPSIFIASRRAPSFFLSVQLSQPYVATFHADDFVGRTFVEIGML